MTQEPVRPGSQRRDDRAVGPIIATLACAGVVASLMYTLTIPLIPDLPRLLHSSASNTAWAVTATLLGASVAPPIAGRLGDMYGKKRLMLVSLVLLIVGSLLCATTSSLLPVVSGRALQGMASGLIPLGISMMRDVLPPARLGAALGLMSSSLGIGGALGIPFSALVAQHADWHVLFWGAAVLGVIMMVVLWWVVPAPPPSGRDEAAGRARFDTVGAIGLLVGLLAVLLVISKGSDWGWTTPTTLGLGLGGVVVLLVWGWWELRVPTPVVDLRVTARRQVLMTNLTSVIVGIAMYALSLVVPQLMQIPTGTGFGFGASMVVAGLCFAPFGVVMVLASPITARIIATFGAKASLMIGVLIVAIGYAVGIAFLNAIWQVIVVCAIVGLGVAFAYAAMPTLIMAAVPPTETAAANGLNTLMRALGTSIASALIGVVLSHLTTTYAGAEVPTLSGFRVTFVIATVAAVAALAVAAFIPGRRAPGAALPTPRPETAPAVVDLLSTGSTGVAVFDPAEVIAPGSTGVATLDAADGPVARS
ncbi:MFS transporter [Frankia sp. R82]|uniref:MFS transporter n=1 Tax=Frankia sp. R82 TaxID=2950553 RepID=UPI0020438661|nr:MFS transporter [Frankia sp. R82]MCM3882414.1 MFS transporter [Frankia sp. R82]